MPDSKLNFLKSQPEGKKSTPAYLRTDGGKTKANSISIPSITIPKGGGAIKGIGEKFQVNAVSGTASLSIPLPLTNARGLTPSLDLSYDSGSGNGIFGLGWALNIPTIRRKTEGELPQYDDANDSDTYIFSEGEDLVPQFRKEADGSFSRDAEGKYLIHEKDSPDGGSVIRFYVLRTGSSISRIERWTSKLNAEISWRIISGDNTTYLYGWSPSSRISDPQKSGRIFEWMLEFVFDDKGNCVNYVYKKEDGSGCKRDLLHTKSRFSEAGVLLYTNVYPKFIRYGNLTPYKKFGLAFPLANDYLFEVHFDYGESQEAARFEEINEWEYRKDSFSNYKPAFEVRTTRLCKSLLFYHCFPELPGSKALVKSMRMGYDHDGVEGFAFLSSLTHSGYIKLSDGSYTSQHLPVLTFQYQQPGWNEEVKLIKKEYLEDVPGGIDGNVFHLVDLYNEGLAGILTEQANCWYYKENLGEGRFAKGMALGSIPSFRGLEQQYQLMDLEGNGERQFASFSAEVKGYFELSETGGWNQFRSFSQVPVVDTNSLSSKFIDLNADGREELVVAGYQELCYYESAGKSGFKAARCIQQSLDEEKGPLCAFQDTGQGIFLADMSGDGLTDIVRVRNGEICYWPNLGHGHFGCRVSMDHAPFFEEHEGYDPSNIRIADINGSGTADIIYLEKELMRCWSNMNGNSFSPAPIVIKTLTGINNLSQVMVADLLGTGTSCIVLSSGLEKDGFAPVKYIDLMGSRKPFILSSYENGMGKKVNFEYQPSTHFFIQDKLSGKPWFTKLHFPVQCVSRIEVHDLVANHFTVRQFQYHHGYFDPVEKEFRGFAYVEELDTDTVKDWTIMSATRAEPGIFTQDPALTRTWYQTGAYAGTQDKFTRDFWYEKMKREGLPVPFTEHQLPPMYFVAPAGVQIGNQERRDAIRSCKGRVLRTEIFAISGSNPRASASVPGKTTLNNCFVQLLQPKGQNKHAVFLVTDHEMMAIQYEKDAADPRIVQQINLQVDEMGNIIESAEVHYGRTLPDPQLPAEIRDSQARTYITISRSSFTNDIDEQDSFRLRLPSRNSVYELKNVVKQNIYFSRDDLATIFTSAITPEEIDYAELNKPVTAGIVQARFIEKHLFIYLADDLLTPLAPGVLGSKGLLHEQYQLAYSPGLINTIFNEGILRLHDPTLATGHFHFMENGWWASSGHAIYLRNGETAVAAGDRFLTPVAFMNACGSVTTVRYYGKYFLMVESIEDALGNLVRILQFNFRTLSGQQYLDPNGNSTAVIHDALGLVKAIALNGKGEGDELVGLNEFTTPMEELAVADYFILANTGICDSVSLTIKAKYLSQHATTRYVYDLHAFERSDGKKPVVLSRISREEHFGRVADAAVQLVFEYMNGNGDIALTKVQSAPGIASQVGWQADGSFVINKVDTSLFNPALLRWTGTGRKVLNNKGNLLKQYESYFSLTAGYDDDKEIIATSVSSLFYYDAYSRLIRTEFPDHTYATCNYESWRHSFADRNDTILESKWYKERVNRLIDPELISEGKDPVKEMEAAVQSAIHDSTPSVQHFGSLGKVVLVEENDKSGTPHYTKLNLDVEGNLRRVTDARDNPVMLYEYDMLGNLVYQKSMDAGQRWVFNNVVGNTVKSWDERQHVYSVAYDALQRVTSKSVDGGDGVSPLHHTYERVIYGDSMPDPEPGNLRLQVAMTYDTAGLSTNVSFDFKGNLIGNTRKFLADHKEVPDWNIPDPAILLSSLPPFETSYQYDALNRVRNQQTSDGTQQDISFNASGQIVSIRVQQAGLSDTVVQHIEYNEKGDKMWILYGNGLRSSFTYDLRTFRLLRQLTQDLQGPQQDLRYTYDPVGNITHVEDFCIPLIFFNNQKTNGISRYAYDTLYRLTSATGREHIAQTNFAVADSWNDLPFIKYYQRGDPMAMRSYTENYSYDKAGNILDITHLANGGNFTRQNSYGSGNNRLISSRVGQDGGVYDYTFNSHPTHGFINSMPHLQLMQYNFRDELQALSSQRVISGTPETTYYVYDQLGQRVRKVTESAAPAGAIPKIKEETIYAGAIEIFRKYDAAGVVELERSCFHVQVDSSKLAIIETRTIGNDGSPGRLIRYQCANYLGSTQIETDGSGRIISFEEFHPFGTTSYLAYDKDIHAAAKRYRYSGQERDEESGFNYHQSRYYLPWLARWLSPDRIGADGGLNLYSYVANDPVNHIDPDGEEKIIVVGGGDEDGKDHYKFFNVGLKKVKEYDDEIKRSGKKEMITIIVVDVNIEPDMLPGLKQHLKPYGKRVQYKVVRTGGEITNYLNSKNSKARAVSKGRMKDKISDIYFAGHGYGPWGATQKRDIYGGFEPGHGEDGEEYSGTPGQRPEHDRTAWGADSVDALNVNIFTKDALFDMGGICNAATDGNTGDNLMKKINKKFNIRTEGWFGKSDYSHIYDGERGVDKPQVRPARYYPVAGRQADQSTISVPRIYTPVTKAVKPVVPKPAAKKRKATAGAR